MRRLKTTKLFVYAALLYPLTLQATELKGRVIHVLDGDTIEVLQDEKPVRIRLANIDAPEKKQAFGNWSANQLKSLIAGKSVTVSYTQEDQYGRIIGRVFTATGTEASLFMVRIGAAWVYERYNTDYALPGIQTQARKDRRGLWVENQPIEPWIWRKNQKMKDNN
ncbi:micrococcal nuclease [Salmonella enterica subsp. enterica serovar Oranienburg]|uniref:Thermonuclease family protein n=1 Tax=Salmonella enterica TaxID=28901 RepID=A0A742YQG7_SALER|nr:micrococcal nuclease [Salmonella enterica subsp. enterica serovar Adelaide]EBQ9876060.1 micrococcal nuclease [Salmonella enterica subsp. enterica serovar Takoradi]ECD6379715.1 micrococcal nuclease [Salmonella enterica subsp. enterica serovar Oranienburg]ECG4909121.1 micrococcal nuclease [Salmonella enterica subsp. enterica serovar Pomona]ECQ0797005.1 thermonuclease family protein [Salmonella enterica subsp. enterica serovar Braenderup]EEE2138643.1 thermonuclease family protein [Salmonella e